MKFLKLVLLSILLYSGISISQPDLSYLNSSQLTLYHEHIKYGQPNSDTLLIRTAYVCDYNTNYRIPNWVAYHIIPDYLNTPERTSRFESFRTDSEVDSAVDTDEYNGLLSSEGYARGHMAPYKIMGGDRDSDGIYAVYGHDVTSDPQDDSTIYQGNLMSNITPQHHKAINGPGGLWYKLERWIQDDLVKANNKEVWIYAGDIVIDTRHLEGVGKNNSIVVPDMYYKIIIMENDNGNLPYVLAFLFPHFKKKEDVKDGNIYDYLVPVDYIEAVTGLDFLNEFTPEEQADIEANVNTDPWKEFINN